jgi:hypothetical protein
MCEENHAEHQANDSCRDVIVGGNQFPNHRESPFIKSRA